MISGEKTFITNGNEADFCSTWRSSMRIFEGTGEIQRRTIARNLLKGHAKLGQLGD